MIMRKRKRLVHAIHRSLLEFVTVVPSRTTPTPCGVLAGLEQEQKSRERESPTEFNNQSQNGLSLVQHVEAG
jgi:hypothetical protein